MVQLIEDRFQIGEFLGQGGMGIVFSVREKSSGRTFAAKFLNPELLEDKEVVRYFQEEATILSKLHHENVVKFQHFYSNEDVACIVTEWIIGTSLRSLINARILLQEDVIDFSIQICRALEKAHSCGVIHRDIKPENILVTDDGVVKVVDFGIAKVLATSKGTAIDAGRRVGSPIYMAPEQIEEPLRVDYRADIYSLAVVMYEMLTGELPLGRFSRPSEIDEHYKVLDPIILPALAKNPDERTGSVKDLRDTLEQLQFGRRSGTWNSGYIVFALLSFVSLFFIFLQFSSDVKPGIYTLAGSRIAGSFDNSNPLLGTLTKPRGIAVDGNGNVFIADSESHLIRRIDGQSGALTTIAGSGTAGFLDHSNPVMGRLNFPTAIAVDDIGNIYFCELNNNRVRKIDATTGALMTVIGDGSNGVLNGPQGVAVDADGNVYVSNTNGRRIVKLTVNTGLLTTIAGSGHRGRRDANSAIKGSFRAPCGLAIDSAGNIFVADADNHSIRMIDAQTGALVTIAGNGTAGLVDSVNASNGRLAFPRAVTVDSAGNVIVGDTGNHAIRMITPGGALKTMAGAGVAGFTDSANPIMGQLDDPHGVVVDANGNIFIADRDNNRIRMVSLKR